MTVKEIFERVLALMFQTKEQGEEYKESFLSVLKMRLSELKRINAELREFKGKEEKEIDPEVDFDSVIELEDELLSALPYGIASIIYVDDDTTGAANVYRIDYESMVLAARPAYFAEAKE